jgi:TonB-linked SusC/RagA family outer membrane protein
MRTKLKGILTLFIAFAVQISFAQEKTVSGTVSDSSGTLPGVTVLIKGTQTGTDTDFDGKYSIKAKPGDVLIFSYIGYKAAERTLGASNTINVTLEESGEVLEEIVITGVAGATNKNKLSISVSSIDEKLLKEVPALNASTALQGKVAGVSITQPSGLPGSGASIRLRGATALTGSQDPLIILDGAFLSGANLSDFNAEDIARIEVLKGAAASSLFGSKAANGVIQIFSKRGKGGRAPSVSIRQEVGITQARNLPTVAKKHAFKVNGDGSFQLDQTGGLIQEEDHIADNNFPADYDHFQDLVRSALSHTESVSVSGGSDNTNYLVSLQNLEQESILKTTDLQGYKRQNFRVNLDVDITDKLKLTTSNLLSKSKSNEPELGVGGVFYNIYLTPRHINLNGVNSEDGSPFDWDGAYNDDPWPSQVTNPLYALNNVFYDESITRVVSNIALSYQANDWLSLNADYSIDNRTFENETFVDKDFLDSEYNNTYVNGYISRFNSNTRNQVFNAFTATNNSFNEFNVKTKLQFLNERRTYMRNTITGTELGVAGVRDLDNVISGTESISSFESTTVSRSLAAIVSLDYKDRYIVDGLFRSDNVSLFGPNVRTQEFYRVSGAYRISKDLNVEDINELKLRASYGTAGLLPPFGAWQDNFSLNSGIATANVVGNPDLGPYVSKEFEAGVDFKIFDRVSGTFSYSNTKNEGQVLLVPLPALVNGGSQYQNAGTLETKSYEATLGFDIIKDRADMSWNVNTVFSKYRSTITEFDRPDLQVGPNNAFLLREGEDYGSFYGERFMTSLTQLSPDVNFGEYSINSRGYVVDGNGAAQLVVDEEGNPVNEKIGNTTPDFNLSFNTTFIYKNFSFYALVDWNQGGDIYNATTQYQYRDFTSPDFDNSASENLTTDFFASLYNVNKTSQAFVEDGSFVKLREVNLSYNISEEALRDTFIKSAKFSIIGRNLLTITDYKGADPEVADITQAGDLSSYRFDNFGFPQTSTFSASILLKF